MDPQPPLTPRDQRPGRLARSGWAVLDPAALCQRAQIHESALQEWQEWPALWDGLRGGQAWYVEAQPFRIDTEGGIGRPAPEGPRREGVNWWR